MKHPRPVIAVTPSINPESGKTELHPSYIQAVEAAGGAAFLLPLTVDREVLECLLSRCGGVLFSGGPDPHPFLWGEETAPGCGRIQPQRDQMELSVLKLALSLDLAVLGICRGIQILNVGLGGSLYQDLSSQSPDRVRQTAPIAHDQPLDPAFPSHHVTVLEQSLLWNITGRQNRLAVNSHHHQAVRQPAPGLIICARSDDGLIEAVEWPEKPFFLGVQWHPERLCSSDPASAGIFRRFLAAAGKRE